MEDPLRFVYEWVGVFLGLSLLLFIFLGVIALGSWIGWHDFLTGALIVAIAGYLYWHEPS